MRKGKTGEWEMRKGRTGEWEMRKGRTGEEGKRSERRLRRKVRRRAGRRNGEGGEKAMGGFLFGEFISGHKSGYILDTISLVSHTDSSTLIDTDYH